jgi:thioredoxin:protein disulfide reductase
MGRTRVRAAAGLIAAALAALPLPGLAAYTDEPLEPEQAFRVRAALAKDPRGKPRAIELRFAIPAGYYLYRDKFKVSASGLPVGALRVPRGVAKDDPFVGPARILKRGTTLSLPFTSPPAPGSYDVHVTAQGCAEDRVCYAPFTQTVQVRIR